MRGQGTGRVAGSLALAKRLARVRDLLVCEGVAESQQEELR